MRQDVKKAVKWEIKDGMAVIAKSPDLVKYCKDDAFMEQACAEAEREFKRNAGPLLAGWLRAGQYRYFIKTLYSYLLWNSWLKKKQARKTYEVEI